MPSGLESKMEPHMSIEKGLFEGKLVRLAPIDHEKDPPIVSRWTHDPYYLRMLDSAPVHPLSVEQVKKKYAEIEKEIKEERNLFYFTIRARQDDRLLGFARLYWIEWNNGNGWVQLGIGEAEERCKGLGSEVLQMMLRLAFNELNLFRLSAQVPEYNQAARRLAARVGFVEEVRRRGALQREGRRWDLLHMGLLKEEWHA
jgi:RimJ/RimL family protein N-acetyltransferase